MRQWFACAVLSLSLVLSVAAQGPTPSNAAQAGHAFAPLQQWANAVSAGDPAGIAAFYSSSPPPSLIVSSGVITDVPREATFWASWKKVHLTHFGVDLIVDQPVTPQLHQIGFEAEIKVQGAAGPVDLFAFVQQTWLRQPGGWKIVSGGRSDLSRLKQPTSLADPIFSKAVNAGAQIAAALSRATAAHKRVLLDFGGNWCYDCHVLDMAFRRSDLAPLLAANYELVNVDVENFDYNLDIVKRYGLSIDKGVPMLAVLDGSGKVLVSSSDGSFEQARRLGPEDLIQYLNAWKPAS
ncbi:MAG: thioredoxin family protein [Terriglobales bacterium]